MDDTTAFMELSALLTGRYNIVTDPEDKALSEPIAKEYQRRLMGVFSARLPTLLGAYKNLASATPPPPINDALLTTFRATQEFMDHEFVAKQIVNIWLSLLKTRLSQRSCVVRSDRLLGRSWSDGLGSFFGHSAPRFARAASWRWRISRCGSNSPCGKRVSHGRG